jgi:hypothetical protein
MTWIERLSLIVAMVFLGFTMFYLVSCAPAPAPPPTPTGGPKQSAAQLSESPITIVRGWDNRVVMVDYPDGIRCYGHTDMGWYCRLLPPPRKP